VTDYRAWLQKFLSPFPIEDKTRAMEDLAARSPPSLPQRNHDVMNHVRHVTPGDYKAKLQPSTIRRLEEIFSGTLETLGYDR
jgi:hypothetical protein